MQIRIHEDVLRRYPDYLMGVIELQITSYDIDALHQVIKACTNGKQIPAINTSVETKWFQVFNEMKASAKRIPSVVALWNLQSRFGELRSINYFVDAYNYVSTKHGIPMGGYDIESLPAEDITLRYAKKGTKFHPLGLNQIEKIKDESEVAYYSGDDVICRYWNNKDSELTKITEVSKKLIIIFDFFGERESLHGAMSELVDVLSASSDISFVRNFILSVDKTNETFG